MAGFNKVILIGNLVADPELKKTPSGVSVTSFRIAVGRRFAGKDGEAPQADFIDIVAWRSTAEFITQYFTKGKPILVCGSIQSRNWTDQNGQKRYTVEVVAEDSTLGEKPYHHSKACDVMALETLNIPAKITRADYTYSGTKISVTYNADGKVVEYHEYFDMYGEGEGGAMGITATLTLKGYFDETWYIEWK